MSIDPDWLADQDEADRRFEASRLRQDEEEDRLRRDAGCDDDCEPDCSCVQEHLEDITERRAMNHDFYRSRGL